MCSAKNNNNNLALHVIKKSALIIKVVKNPHCIIRFAWEMKREASELMTKKKKKKIKGIIDYRGEYKLGARHTDSLL